MKALTIWQPWASAIPLGYKHYETRGYAIKYRGPIAIHAAANIPKVYEVVDLNDMYAMGNLSVRFELDKDKKLYIQTINDIVNGQKGTLLPYKSIVAVADLVDCIPVTKEFMSTLDNDELALGWYAQGRYAWKLENVRSIQPIQCKGQQSLWNAEIENIIQFL